MNSLWILLMLCTIDFTPLKSKEIQRLEMSFSTKINDNVIAQYQEELLISKALEYLACRESGFNYRAISPTSDFGKYQINSSNLYARGINPYQFLEVPYKQEEFARKFMKIHIKDYLKNPQVNIYWQKSINKEVLINSWAGVGTVVNNLYAYSRIILKRKGCECYE